MKVTHREEWSNLIFITAISLGAIMRFNPTVLAGFPISDGGMFAVMVDDLKASHYLLPIFTTYNHLNIPYAYPPLGFYFGRIAGDLFGLTSTQSLRWVPAFFASLSIPAFYLLAWRLFRNKYYASYATLFFALMPRALSWFVSGGGLTRSVAQFFMLLTLAAVVRLYKEDHRSDIFWAGIFAGLTVMSHPEATVHMIASVIFLWVMLGHSRATFIQSLGVGMLAFITAAPWWGTVIHYHGIAPLLSAAQTGQKTAAVLNLLTFNFSEELYATMIAVLGLLGLASRLIRRDYLLPLWIVLPFLVEGRSAILPAAIPLALLAAIGLVDVVLKALLPDQAQEIQKLDQVSRAEFGIALYGLLFLVFSTYQFGAQLSTRSLSLADREAMDWVRQNTPVNSRFLVLTGTNAVTCDLVLEWFPALTGRQSLLTVQGTEWTEGANFSAYVRSTYAVQQCLPNGGLSCLDAEIDRSGYDFVYISKIPHINCVPVNFPSAFSDFIESIRMELGFKTVYESEQAIIFAK